VCQEAYTLVTDRVMAPMLCEWLTMFSTQHLESINNSLLTHPSLAPPSPARAAPSPEYAECVSPVAAHLLPEARAVAHHALGQVRALKPALAVHRAQRLLTGGDKVLVIALTWGAWGGACEGGRQCSNSIWVSIHLLTSGDQIVVIALT
jgi:hypothetical protein